MNEEEFLEMAKEKAHLHERVKNNNFNKATEYRFNRKHWIGIPKPDFLSLEDYLYVEWCVNYEPEKNLDDFDDIVLSVCPNITLFQYKTLTRKALKSDAWTEYGYEDDDKDTIHSCRYVKLKDLYDALIEMGLLK
jgi:hypothetical protein